MRKIKIAALSLCFILLLGTVINTAADIVRKKGSIKFYSQFWQNPEEYDVWFMGTSRVYFSIQPMELWNRYGIRSYNLGSSGSSIPQVYWTLMCALEYSEPQVVVLDTFNIHLQVKYQRPGKMVHTGIDEIPLSAMKIRGVCDMFDTWKERFEYLCGFSIYHNRWEELTSEDFNVTVLETKGARFQDKIVDNSDYQMIGKEDMSVADTVGFLYLEKIIAECQKRGIRLILTELPFCGDKDKQRAMNAVPQVAEEHGLTCLNMMYEEGLLDKGTDFGDNVHVNLFGAEKITDYVGNYLSEHCNLADYRESAEIAAQWNADYEKYLQRRTVEMRDAGTVKSYVQWLADDRYVCYMYQGKEPDGLLERELAKLDNITYISREEAKERLGEEIKGDYAFLVENHSGEILDKAVFQKGKRL